MLLFISTLSRNHSHFKMTLLIVPQFCLAGDRVHLVTCVMARCPKPDFQGFHPFIHISHDISLYVLCPSNGILNSACETPLLTAILPCLVLFLFLGASLLFSFLPTSLAMFSFSKHLMAMNTLRFYPNSGFFFLNICLCCALQLRISPLPLHLFSPCSVIFLWTFLWAPMGKTLFSLLIPIDVNFKFGINTP